MTDDRQRAREVLANHIHADHYTSVDEGAEYVRFSVALDAMLAFATPSTPEAGVEIPPGMKPWTGGDSAPDDWDGGQVMTRDGSVYLHDNTHKGRWQHGAARRAYYPHRPDLDIVAYTSKPIPADIPTNDNALRERIARWIGQAIERADKHGNTEGIWLFADQWRFVLAALSTPSTAARPDVDRLKAVLEFAQCDHEGEPLLDHHAAVISSKDARELLVALASLPDTTSPQDVDQGEPG